MKLSKLKKGIFGLFFLLTHPKRALYLGWLEKKHNEAVTNEEEFKKKI